MVIYDDRGLHLSSIAEISIESVHYEGTNKSLTNRLLLVCAISQLDLAVIKQINTPNLCLLFCGDGGIVCVGMGGSFITKITVESAISVHTTRRNTMMMMDTMVKK